MFCYSLVHVQAPPTNNLVPKEPTAGTLLMKQEPLQELGPIPPQEAVSKFSSVFSTPEKCLLGWLVFLSRGRTVWVVSCRAVLLKDFHWSGILSVYLTGRLHVEKLKA